MKRRLFGLSIVVLLMSTFVLPLMSVQAGDRSQNREEYVLDSNTPSRTFPIMHPDDLTVRRWQERYERAPRAFINENIMRNRHAAAATRGAATATDESLSSTNILDRLTYSPTESQGSCGDCWAWAGTRVMGVDLNTQEKISANLSVQYINSCYGDYACCGGWLSDVVDFYNSKKKAIPKSNTNATFADASYSCKSYGSYSKMACNSISTITNYPISSVSEATITTTGVSQDTAIANIKNVLDQGKAIWFAFYLPTSTAWNNFYNFWNNQSESAVWNSDTYCGQTWSSSGGGGHAVTIVGYDDSSSSTADHYWIVLNSWGTTTNRSNGLFRVKMYVNYGCTFSRLSSYALTFQTLNIQWGETTADTTAPTVTSFTVPDSSTSLTVSINSFTATDNVGVTGYMVTTSSTAPSASSTSWLTSAPASYTFDSSTTSGTKKLYAWAKDAAGNVSTSANASVTLNIASGGADLVISSISNKATMINMFTRTFSVTDTTKNQGSVSSSASTTRYYLSTTTSKTSSSKLLTGTRSVAALAAGASSAGTVTVRVPSGITRTTYYLVACADDASSVTESSESNNCLASSSRITVSY
jgi:C1A family cysteine protease